MTEFVELSANRERLRASVLIQHLRSAPNLTFNRQAAAIVVSFRNADVAEWCWEYLTRQEERP